MSDERELTITATRSEYKGHPMLILSSGTNEKYPFQFGLQKAKRIVAAFEAIKAFVAEEDAKANAAATKTVAVK